MLLLLIPFGKFLTGQFGERELVERWNPFGNGPDEAAVIGPHTGVQLIFTWRSGSACCIWWKYGRELECAKLDFVICEQTQEAPPEKGI